MIVIIETRGRRDEGTIDVVHSILRHLRSQPEYIVTNMKFSQDGTHVEVTLEEV